MITYHGLGYYGFLLGIPGIAAVGLIPAHTRIGQLARRAVWTWIGITVAIIVFSY